MKWGYFQRCVYFQETVILTTNILENGSMLMFLPHCVIFGNLSLWNLQRCRSPPVKDWNLVFTRLQPWCHTGGSRNGWIVQKSLCCGQCEDATSMKVIYEERTELIKHLGCSCWPQGQLMLPFLTSCTSIKVKRYLQRAFICPCDILKHLCIGAYVLYIEWQGFPCFFLYITSK